MQNTLISYWERESWLGHFDVVIAGSGIVGLNAALSLKLQVPRLRILVAERGALPTGASTKNAGFACYGSMTELLDDLEKRSQEEVFALVEKRYRGLQKLRSIVGDDSMELEIKGGYEVFDDEEQFHVCTQHIPDFNKMLKTITGEDGIYSIADDEIRKMGLGRVKHMILNKGEGQINTGKMLRKLLDIVREKGIEIISGLHIRSEVGHGNKLELSTENGYRISCSKLIICTNGFAKEFLPDEDVNPARAQVLITQPVEGLQLSGTFHYDEGYYYFRNVGNRVLLGGGRNLDFKGETTTSHQITDRIQSKLDELLREMILPDKKYEVDMRWAGTMGVGMTKSPIVKKVDTHIFCAVRMGGMGVALGSLTGEEVADLVMKDL